MKSNGYRSTAITQAVLLVLAAGLSGCGGDGGGDQPTSIALTATNRDSVSHASAGSVLAFSSAGAVIPVGGGSAAPQSASRTGQVASWLPARVVDSVLQAARQSAQAASTGMKRPLAQYPLDPINCTISGQVLITLDDRNNNGVLDVGDMVSMVFNSCKDFDWEVVDGRVDATYTAIGTGAYPPVSMRMTMTNLADVQPNHAMTLNGALDADYMPASATFETYRYTAAGPVKADLQTHQFSDTVTLQQGYVSTSETDYTVVPPGGGSTNGRTTTTVSGQVVSMVAGGQFSVSTGETPLVSYFDDVYPSSGALTVTGSSGKIVITPLSAASVRIDLDANGDGTFESTTTQTWDWLL
jgi:hypothetical protein